MSSTIISIREFYRGKCIFITGGSGFIGRVLIENLIRCCPDIGVIYILLRPKGNKTLQNRAEKILDDNLFHIVREMNSENLKKLIFLAGDISQIKLGMSDKDYEEVVKNVDIIFHVGATVRFTEDLTDAVLINIRGTREVCNMALAMKNKPILVHVSTVYSQHENAIIEEKLYKSYGNWKESITIAELMDRDKLNIITPKFKGLKSNTYIFTKALAEVTVRDLCAGNIPTIVIRPAIVYGSMKDPFPGYCMGYSGLIGVTAASFKGILKVIHIHPEMRLESIPVDFISKCLVNSVWLKGTGQSNEEITVINGSSLGILDYKNKDLEKSMQRALPLCRINLTWYPQPLYSPSYIYCYLYSLIFQLLPFAIGDLLLRLQRRKPYLLQLQRIVFRSMNILDFFMGQEWDMKNNNFLKATVDIPDDQKDFVLDISKDDNILRNSAIDHMHYFQKYYFNEPLMDRPINPTKLFILKHLNNLIYGVIYATLGYGILSFLICN